MSEFVTTYGPVIWVTLVYVLVYYALMINGMLVKIRVARRCKEGGEPFLRYTGNYPEILAADRAQLNTLEHMPPFLALMWLHAFIVSPDSAAVLGACYVVVRITYPFFLGTRLERSFPKRVFINTFSGYLILIIFGVWQAAVLLDGASG